jgi:hypothetical protein
VFCVVDIASTDDGGPVDQTVQHSKDLCRIG